MCLCGTEDQIVILDLVKNKELGSILEVTGPIIDSCFTILPSHGGKECLVVAAGSRSISFFSCEEWIQMKVLRNAHKKDIVGISAHPSGKILLSVGKDRLVKLWNLQSFTLAHQILLPSAPIAIEWSFSGKYYAILYEKKVEIYSIDNSQSKSTDSPSEEKDGKLASGNNPNCISYGCPDETKFTSFGWSIDLDTEVVVLGTESGKISLFLPTRNLSFPIGEHIGSRVRCIRCIKDGKFISCSSDGVIKIWSILQNTATLLAEKNCSMRILSLGVYE